MTGEQLERSFNSASSSIICVTSASKSPILKQNAEECHRPNLHQRGGWSSPVSSILCRTSVSSPDLSLEEGEIIEGMTNNGVAWIPSRWGHLV
jgi:hypothetical protein